MFWESTIRSVCISSLCCFSFLFSTAQHRYFTTFFDTQNGLSEPFIGKLYQDKKGFLWVATRESIYRYDGIKFEPFSSRLCQQGNWIMAIDESPARDEIWFLSPEKISLYRDGFFSDTISLPRDYYGKHAHGLYFDKHGGLWLGTIFGVWYFDANETEQILFNKSFPKDNQNRILKDTIFQHRLVFSEGADGTIYFNAGASLYRVSEDKKVKEVGKMTDHTNTIESILPIQAGVLAGTRLTGLWLFPSEGSAPARHIEATAEWHSVHNLMIYKDLLWVADSEGIWGFDPASLKEIPGTQLTEYKNMSPGFGFIFCAIIDRSGNYWAGTNNGLFKFSKTIFSVHPFPKMKKHWKWGVYSVGEDLFGRLVIGGNNSKVWRREKRIDSLHCITGNMLPPFETELRKLTIDKKGNIWTTSGWNDLLRIRNGRFEVFDIPDETGLTFHSLLFDQKERLWIGYNRGALMMESAMNAPAPGKFKPYGRSDNILDESDAKFCFAEDKYGNVLAGGPSGLTRWDDTEHRFIPVMSSGFEINHLLFTTEGECWAVSVDSGLVKLDLNQALKCTSKTVYWLPATLSENEIFCMEADPDGNIWLGSPSGISVLKKMPDGRRRFFYFNYQDGLVASNYETINMKFLRDTMWVATSKGLMAFKPRDFVPDATPIEIAITDASENGIPFPDKLLQNKMFDWQSTLAFNIATLSFDNPGKLHVVVMLRINGKDISCPVEAGRVFLPKMQAGQYILRISAFNKDGIPNPNDQIITFYVRSFWQSPLFYSLLGAVLAMLTGVVLLLQNLRLRDQSKAESEKKKKLLEIRYLEGKYVVAKDKNDREVMDAHIRHNLWMHAYNLACSDDTANLQYYLKKLGDFSIEITKLAQSDGFIAIRDEISFLKQYLELEKIRVPDLSFSIQLVSEPVEDKDEDYDDPNDLKIPAFMLQTIVENAIKHALPTRPKGKQINVLFEVSSQNQQIICTVRDNGMGNKGLIRQVPLRLTNTGLGMENVYHRIDQLNNVLKDPIQISTGESDPSDPIYPGTQICIVFPNYMGSWLLDPNS